jgi:hypothetical protein
MQLGDIQNQFKNLMLDHPDTLDNLDSNFAAAFKTGNIELSRRLSVYRNNVVGSLSDAIIATCPTLEKLVGKDFLERMARSFVLKRPPLRGCLNTYGAGFDDFIAAFKPAESLPYLPDIAQLDLAMNPAYYAQDQIAMTAENLATIPPESLGDTRLKICDHVHLLKSQYPIDKIYEFCQIENPDYDLDVSAGGVCVMVFRQNFSTQLAVLDEGEFEMLTALHTLPLGEALESVMGENESFDFQTFLQKHMALETFCCDSANSDIRQ